MKLKSIKQEAADCRKAFEGIKVGALVLHCHHGILAEQLTEPAENRIAYILESKSGDERALRLRLFRPVSETLLKSNAKYSKAYEDWNRAKANRQKAAADWRKANADWLKAYADWRMANDDWLKANADWLKADADWRKSYEDWNRAEANRQKADADLVKIIHGDVCKGCPWDGKTIFPEGGNNTR